MAKRACEVAEEQRRNCALVDWHAWLEEGPCRGLRRQHQLTRTATGWIPTAKAPQDPTEMSDMDEVEGLSGEELDKILHNPGAVVAPSRSPADCEQGSQKMGCRVANRWRVP